MALNSNPIELVSLLQVTGKVDLNNKCDVWRGQVISANRRTMEAYIKYLPDRAIFVECVAAQIGRALGLSIPRPVLVKVYPAQFPELHLQHNSLFFGSEDAKYPSLQQFVPINRAYEELKKWPDIIQAGCFDEWIANVDRHNGNILYQGSGKFSLIDHSHAVPKSQPHLDKIKHNSFLKIIAPNEKDELGVRRVIKQAKKELPAFLKIANNDWLEVTQSSLYCEESKAKQVCSFLNERLEVLSVLIGEQLGDKQQDLYATS